MAEEFDIDSVLKQLEDKVREYLQNNQPYEALQYVQSFVARKKKGMGQNITSKVVFHGAQKLVENGGGSSAGVLIKWFIDGGAGAEHSFKVIEGNATLVDYCDVQRLLDLMSPLTSEQCAPVADVIYSPLHLMVAKAKLGKNPSSPLAKRLDQFEEICAKAFLASEKWLPAFKAFVRLNQMELANDVLLKWSAKGYETEKPMFFARALIYLLAEAKVTQANTLLSHAVSHVADNIAADSEGGGPSSAPLAIWHVATILTDLANFPPNLPRVDKTKLFGLLYNRYLPLLMEIDTITAELFLKAGEVTFNFKPTPAAGAPAPANPMAMLQGMLGASAANSASAAPGAQKKKGAGAAPPAAPALDMDQMLRMMKAMQQTGGI